MKLTPEQYTELKESFDYNDLNGDGKIEPEEFRRMLEALDVGAGPEEIRLGFAAIDTDGDGGIEFDEFVDWWCER